MIAAEPKTTGQYQPYPQYKDSGVEWYKNIPTGWNIERFKFAVRKLESGTSVNAVDTPAEASQIGVLKTSAVYTGVFRHSENKAVVESDLTRVSCPVKKGCLIVSRMNTPDLVGAAGLVAETVDNLYLPDRLWQVHIVEKHAKFSHYWTLTPEYRNQVRLVCSGTSSSMQNLSQEQFLNFLVPSPSDDEKNSIAAFLDYETARIDRLVAQQQRLIELLKEKRQAVISHAVTKGLNPNAPMKDSGVEWLGQVPEHWQVMALRHLLNAIEQGKSPECEARTADVNEWGVLKTGCVNGGKYNQNEHKALPSHIPPHTDYEVCQGDVLMSRASGSRHLIGAVAYVDATREKLLLSDKVFRLILNRNVDPLYFAFLMSSTGLRAQVELAINGAEGLANNITKEAIKNFITALPDHKEQREIRVFIEQEQSKFSALEECLREGLGLLQERRSALISAAVTGKIDLRDWTPPAGEVAA